MKKYFYMIITLVLCFTMAQGCSTKSMGMSVPAPNETETPGEDPGKPSDEEKPGSKQDSLAKWINNPERLARIGQTPIVEVYYTEYTSSRLFPSSDEARCFTHVNVGHGRFVNKDTGDGGISIADPDLLRRWVNVKKSYPELKVKFMIGGWGRNADGFSQMARDPQKRKLFVEECLRIVREYGVDGFDIDWEYPTHAAKDGDHRNGAIPEDWQNFVTLFKELREAMPDKILSYAASDSGKYTDNYGVLPYVDYINVMTYSDGNPPYHNASLYRSAITKSRSCAEAIDDIFHKGQDIPYEMMNFGVAFYGHGDGYDKKEGNSYPSSVDYSKLEDIFFRGKCDGYDVSGKNYRVWDDVAKVPYLADATGRMYASYEDIESVNAKVEYLKSRGMLGAMIWEYRHDNDEGTLRKAVRHAMDGRPDAPGRLERPDENRPEHVAPVMGKLEWSKELKKSNDDYVIELSGLCLSKDKDFLWGVGDNGHLYKINFDGSYELHWSYDADMEGITMDPATGDLYLGIEPRKVYKVAAPDYNAKKTIIEVEEAADMDNSGIEGIAWYKGDLYLGAQTGATLWKYALDGTKLQKKMSLRTVAPTISEVADLCYDPESDLLWVIDSNEKSSSVPNMLPYTIYVFDGAVTKLVTTFDVSSFADWNPESVCVDHEHNCVWVADDCGDDYPSRLHKISFEKL